MLFDRRSLYAMLQATRLPTHSAQLMLTPKPIRIQFYKYFRKKRAQAIANEFICFIFVNLLLKIPALSFVYKAEKGPKIHEKEIFIISFISHAINSYS